MKRILPFLPLILLLLFACAKGGVKAPARAPNTGEPNSPPREPKSIPFISVPGGTFDMGDVENLGGSRGEDELPVHAVTVSPFQMSANEITNAQYALYLNEALETKDIIAMPERAKGAKGPYRGAEYIYLAGSIEYLYPGNRCWIVFEKGRFAVTPGKEKWPVTYVTWYGAKAFARHYALDLPTEAEWEYACRGGRKYAFGTDDGTISPRKANFDEKAGGPVDVRSYPPNPFGLYDMSGNVWEWCHDRYGMYSEVSAENPTGASRGIFRVVRGGAWNLFASHCRAADRNFDIPVGTADYLGFRVVRRQELKADREHRAPAP